MCTGVRNRSCDVSVRTQGTQIDKHVEVLACPWCRMPVEQCQCKQKEIEKTIEKRVEVERRIEVPVERRIEMPVERIVERIVERAPEKK